MSEVAAISGSLDAFNSALVNITGTLDTLTATANSFDVSKIVPDAKAVKKTDKGFKGMFKSIGLGFLEAASPIGLVVGALQALGFLQPIVATITGLVGILSIGFAPILDIILALIMTLIPIFEGVSNVIEPFANILSATLMPIIAMLTPIFSALMTVLDPIMGVILPLVQILMNLFIAFSPIQPILMILVPLINIVASVITFLLTPLTAVLNLFSNITGIFVEVKEGMMIVLDFITSVVGTFVTGMLDFMSGFLSDILNFFPNLIGKLRQGMADAIDEFGDIAADLGGAITDTITGWFS